MLSGLLLALAVPCSAAVAPARLFRISGVAVNSTDGSPVPYCRLTATAVSSNPNGDTGRGFGRSDSTRGGGVVGFVGGDFGQFGGFPGGGRGRGPASSEAENATTADAQGRFTLNLPHGGPWRLTGVARGYRSQSYDEHDGFYAEIVLSDTAPSDSITFQMERESVLTGLVLDEAGEPVRQARVTAGLVSTLLPGQFPVPSRAAGNATTDDRGRYELSGLAPGSYRVRVQAQPWYAVGNRGTILGNQTAPQNDLGAALDPSLDLVYATTWYPGADNEDAAVTIALSGGEERQADFQLNAVSAIHLRVPRPDAIAPAAGPTNGRQGQPNRIATITKISADGSPSQVTSVGGSGNGDWDFGGLTPGIYEVRMPGPDGQPGGGEVRQVEVQAGSRIVVMDSAKPLTKVTINVEGLPAESFPLVQFTDVETGRRIVAQENRGRGGRGRRGDDDNPHDDQQDDQPSGLTVMLPLRRYAVTVAGNSGIYLSSITATDAQVVGHTVSIAGGNPILNLQVGVGRAELSGFVRQGAMPANAAVEGAMVLLVPISLGQPGDVSAVTRSESNSDGSFAFRNVEPGRYIAVAIERGWQVQIGNPQTLANYLAKGVPVELKSGGKVSKELAAVLP